MEHLSTGHPVQHCCLLYVWPVPDADWTKDPTFPHFGNVFQLDFFCLLYVSMCFWYINIDAGPIYGRSCLVTPAVAQQGLWGSVSGVSWSGANTAVSHIQPGLTLSLPHNPLILTTRDDYLLITATRFSVIAI